jgi:hypothetical protein
MTFRLSTALALTLALNGANAKSTADTAHEGGVLAVPLVTLILAPERIAGHRVTVFGYYYGSALHLTRDHALNFDPVSNISVVDTTGGQFEEQCWNRYIHLEGRFIKVDQQYRLTDLTRGMQAEGPDCWPLGD